MTIKIGQKLPSFILPNQNGDIIDSKTLLGKKVVLYFYPKDNTPGCTVEGQEFTQLKPQFDKKHTVILGISKQGVDSHKRFCDKFGFTFDLLVDTDGILHEKLGITSRSTILIDEKSIIEKIWANVSPRGHARVVLQSIA